MFLCRGGATLSVSMYYFEEVKVLPLQGQGSAVFGEMNDLLIFVRDYCYISAFPLPPVPLAHPSMVQPLTVKPVFLIVMVKV